MKINCIDLDSLDYNEYLAFVNCLLKYFEVSFGHRYELVSVDKYDSEVKI